MIQVNITHTVTQEFLIEFEESDLIELAAKVGFSRNEGETTDDFITRAWDSQNFQDLMIKASELIDECAETTIDEVTDDDE